MAQVASRFHMLRWCFAAVLLACRCASDPQDGEVVVELAGGPPGDGGMEVVRGGLPDMPVALEGERLPPPLAQALMAGEGAGGGPVIEVVGDGPPGDMPEQLAQMLGAGGGPGGMPVGGEIQVLGGSDGPQVIEMEGDGGEIPPPIMQMLAASGMPDGMVMSAAPEEMIEGDPMLGHMLANMGMMGPISMVGPDGPGNSPQRGLRGRGPRRGGQEGFLALDKPPVDLGRVPRACTKDFEAHCKMDGVPLVCLAKHTANLTDSCKVELFLSPCKSASDNLCDLMEEGIMTCLNRNMKRLDGKCQKAVTAMEKAIKAKKSMATASSARTPLSAAGLRPMGGLPKTSASSGIRVASEQSRRVTAGEVAETASAPKQRVQARAVQGPNASAQREKELDERAATAAKSEKAVSNAAPAPAQHEKELDARIVKMDPKQHAAEGAPRAASGGPVSSETPMAAVHSQAGDTSASASAKAAATTASEPPRGLGLEHLRGAVALGLIGGAICLARSMYPSGKAPKGANLSGGKDPMI